MPTKTCFVIMPFGQKTDVAGQSVDFDRIFDEILEPVITSVGLTCVRSDRVDESGNIHRRMFELIWTAEVAIVDISLLNPNVFYELGIRHALRGSTTILIRRRGTGIPFNISNLNILEYDESDPASVDNLHRKIRRFIEVAYSKGHIDSYVHDVLSLRISGTNKPVSIRQEFPFAIEGDERKRLLLVTGDLRNIHGIDIWVNSENTNMQMARYYEPYVSSVIRYEGATKSAAGHVQEDTINEELQSLMDGQHSVPASHVLATSAGQLSQKNGVKRIFHVAAVVGSIAHGYRAVEPISDCITNALRVADSTEFREEGLSSILFPLLGISTPLQSARETVQSLIDAALGYLLNYPASSIEDVYFLAWSEAERDLCLSVFAGDTRVRALHS